MDQAHLIISGKVQGVCYRASCQDVAVRHGLNGWVKNLSSGQVEVLVQGDKKEEIEKLIEWCKKGPPSSRVIEVSVEWENTSEKFNGFSVIS